MQPVLYKLFLLALAFFVIMSIHKTFAHETGPSYIFINGKNTTLNVAQAFSHNPGFILGTDLAPDEKYIVGTPVAFKIDEKNFFTPNNAPAEFQWDFQDGSPRVDGASAVHAFENPGSYFVNLYARHDKNTHYTNADIVQLNVVASTEDPVPFARIMVNGKIITDYKQKMVIPLNTEIELDASQSTGRGLRYYWELGEGTRSRDKKIMHTYKGTGESTFFPLLRVTDDQSVVSDAIVTITSEGTISPSPKASSNIVANFFSAIWKFLSNLFK